MRLRLLALLAILGCPLLGADAPPSPLTIAIKPDLALIIDDGLPSISAKTGKMDVEQCVYIKNVSNHKIRVFTALPQHRSEVVGKTLILYNALLWSEKSDRVIPSEVDLKPVVLEPQERAILNQRRPDLNPNVEHVKFVYTVPAEWGKRFDAWTGTIETPLSGEVQLP